jgi:hypothetical protein
MLEMTNDTGNQVRSSLIRSPQARLHSLRALPCNAVLLACCTAIVSSPPAQAHAQFTDPRTYNNSPVGLNQLELAYAYARANASLDTSLIIEGAHLNLNQGTISYTRYFGLFHRLAWVEPSLPIAVLNGSVTGTTISGATTGAGDSSYQVAMLVKGGPALSVKQFADFKPRTALGGSVTITAPTGQYKPDKILNLGADRWSFKPELALSCPFGAQEKWEADLYANSYFFTDNYSYRGVQLLRQEPLAGLEAHLSYSLLDSLWISLDTRYSFRGDTLVDGVNQHNPQKNFLLGSEVNMSLNARNSLVIVLGKALVHENGPAVSAISVKYDYTWGKGYK